jgi:hypothetical protein
MGLRFVGWLMSSVAVEGADISAFNTGYVDSSRVLRGAAWRAGRKVWVDRGIGGPLFRNALHDDAINWRLAIDAQGNTMLKSKRKIKIFN